MHIQEDSKVLRASNGSSNVGETNPQVSCQPCILLAILRPAERSPVLHSFKVVFWIRMVGVVVGCI